MTERDRSDGGSGKATAPDDLLDAALGAARADARRSAPDALLARIEADALIHLPQAPRREVPGRGPMAALTRFLAPMGGWPALGGLAAAAAAGLWIGISPPAAVEAQGGWLGGVTDDLALILPGDYFAEAEEG
jgi:hypothetical protein